MAPAQSPRTAGARRARKSIAHPPSSELGFDKENQTLHNIGPTGQPPKAAKRGLRSQSLGAGELNALKEGTGNRQKILPLPRSILKPTIPPSPLRNASDQNGSGSPGINRHNGAPHANRTQDIANTYEDRASEGSDGTIRIGLKTEEQQQAAARERDRQEAQQRREERRKSLANRRVSFAPEATLHTWDVVELPEDATSSTEATNLTRRASNGSSLPASPYNASGEPMSDNSDAPSTPPRDEIQVAASPADQRDLHQKKRRRSSTATPMDSNGTPVLSSSPVSSVASDDTYQSSVSGGEEVIDASDSDEDKDLEAEETVTATAIDNDDTTENSVASASAASNSSHQLDMMLREATQRAHTQGARADGVTEDMSMEIANEDTTGVLSAQRASTSKAPAGSEQQDDEEDLDVEEDSSDMDMEVTQPVGGILLATASNGAPSPKGKRKSVSGSRRLTNGSRRQSAGQASVLGDETMEFTTAIGTIEQSQDQEDDQHTSQDDEDEEMTMEFTSVVGGLEDQPLASRPRRSFQTAADVPSLLDDDTMDMTVARGGILSPVTERTEPSDESAMGMDFTAAVGAILPNDLKVTSKNDAKLLMEEEVDHGQLTRSPFKQSASKPGMPEALQSQNKLLKSTDFSFSSPQRPVSRRGSASPARSATRSSSRLATPLKNVGTPTKQLTPQPGRPTTPSKTPPAKNVSMRKTSPKTLFKADGKKRASSSPARRTPDAKAQPSRKTISGSGMLPQNLVLTPTARRYSGTGIDQEGLGSPHIAAVLDRRGSIGERAETFTPLAPGASSVRFADPRVMELEIDRERSEEQRRESGRGVMQMEASSQAGEDNDTTSTLRGMIDGLTPKKNKLNGRKSLAVGAARGILGKRPAELDEDDEDATPKRLKGIPHSPVKKVHLPAPPTKVETTGRSGKSAHFGSRSVMNVASTPLVQTSPRKTASTPNEQGRFWDTKTFQSAEKPPVSFNEQLAGEDAHVEESAEEDRIHLRDFLNMTSIRFMELTTTKRRHTVLPGKDGDDTTTGIGEVAGASDDRSVGACVVAGASTIPMLELYQHSCRELKKYISEGRSIVKEIEDDTHEDNPALFREYMSAPPQVRAIMDNQFKNVKTHARLHSKAMWYEWRMKLLDGLKEGLVKIKDGLYQDQEVIAKQERLLEPIVPKLAEEHETLESTTTTLQRQADELANCDQDELREARQRLVGLDDEIAAAKKQVEQLQGELREKDQGVETAKARKATCVQDIKEAEAVREQYRGWSASEVATLKARIDGLEKTTGWSVSSAQGQCVTFTYKSSLSVYLAPSAFKGHGPADRPNSTMSLFCSASDSPSTTERFFLQLLRARVLGIAQAQTPLREVLKLLETGWELARRVGSQVADLTAQWPTEAAIRGDDRLRIASTVLLREARTKVETGFDVVVGGAGTQIWATVGADAASVYGQELKTDKMARVLGRETAADKDAGGIANWAGALGTLQGKVELYLREKHA